MTHTRTVSELLLQTTVNTNMGSRSRGNIEDLWSEIIAGEDKQHYPPEEQEIDVVYQRKPPAVNPPNDAGKRAVRLSSSNNGSRLSLAPVKRDSLRRSLSVRGRTSIAVTACIDSRPEQRKPRRAKPPLPKRVQPPNFDKERAYFQEVDSFELLEESPSPKRSGTWTMGLESDDVFMSHLSSVLHKWLISRRLNRSCAPSGSLSKILETPLLSKGSVYGNHYGSSTLKNPEISALQMHSGLSSVYSGLNTSDMDKEDLERHALSQKSSDQIRSVEEEVEDMELAVAKLSLTSRPGSSDGNHWDPFLALLTVCRQEAPSTLLDVLSKYSEPDNIVKAGEGTYGEAFKVGKTVCKIVPFNGDLRVNGEVQKRSEELLEEVVLSRTLNCLRGHEGDVYNACTSFIETMDLRVCQGSYDASLIKAWEDWDLKHGSENDHPKEFPDDQCYVVFVQEHGGQDLESFVLLNFDEVQSLLVQITFALAVAEAAYEFEHRDLHWGNILLSRKDSATLQFTLDGKQIKLKTFGLLVSIIDFTLSRINNGEDILFMDLSSDPEIFEGPKGDKQSDTYRKMKVLTEECWEGSFPKTNVLWLQYLVDILLLKKSYDRTSKDERDLRSLKKRLNTYDSAKEATSDPFFSDLFC